MSSKENEVRAVTNSDGARKMWRYLEGEGDSRKNIQEKMTTCLSSDGET